MDLLLDIEPNYKKKRLLDFYEKK